MARRAIILRDLTQPVEVQQLRAYLLDLYGRAGEPQSVGVTETTNATVTTLLQLPLDDGASYFVEARVVARRTGGAAGSAGDSAAYIRQGLFYRTGGGGATQVGATATPLTLESVAGYDCALDTNGNDVRLRITGAANTSITWSSVVVTQRV